MTDLLDQALDSLYDKVMEMPNKVLSIFNNFFGEERVDMQGFISKSRMKKNILEMQVRSILQYSSMMDKATTDLIGLPLDTRLKNIGTNSVYISALTEAILSQDFIDFWKDEETGFILVHFPKTIVTNEYNKSTVVNNLYAKVPITIDGSEDGVFTMNRSEYTVSELRSNYMHSHVDHIPTDNFEDFRHCCLGRGPLNNTQTMLSTGFDEDRWNIFCLELSKYVEVESIAGTPYHRLENITNNTSRVNVDRLFSTYYIGYNSHRESLMNNLKEFISYYIDNNDLTFSYRNGIYSIGIPYVEYIIKLSNSFIDWVNSRPDMEYLKDSINLIMDKYNVINGNLYKVLTDANVDRYRQYLGSKVCTFKGNTIRIVITDIDNISSTENYANIINPRLASCLLNKILRTINYRYGRNQEDPNSTSGKVRYKI